MFGYEPFELHFFAFCNEECLTLNLHLLHDFFNPRITGARFTNYKVEENNASNNNCPDPHEPENLIVNFRQGFDRANGREISKAHSECPKEFSQMESNWFVLLSRTFRINKTVSLVFLIVVVSKPQHCKNLRKEGNEYNVKQKENPKIIDDLAQHDNDGGQQWEDPKEKEGLN